MQLFSLTKVKVTKVLMDSTLYHMEVVHKEADLRLVFLCITNLRTDE